VLPISFPFDLLPPLLRGAVVTLEITALSAIVAFFMAFLAGFGRLSNYGLIRVLARVYVEIFRGTSLLVQMFWMYFVFPFFGLQLSALVVAVLALGLNFGAYGSEVVRSGILAVPAGQTEAAVALNMTPWRRMWHIILPQAILLMLPAFGNQLIELLKATSLVSLITVSDLTFRGMLERTATLQTTDIFILLLVLYFVMASPLALVTRWIEHKVSLEGRVAGARRRLGTLQSLAGGVE